MIRRVLERRRFMREHRWTDARLSDYLDEQLAARDRGRVDEHIGRCPQCRRMLATLRRTLEELRSLSVEAHPGIADGVLRRLHREPEADRG